MDFIFPIAFAGAYGAAAWGVHRATCLTGGGTVHRVATADGWTLGVVEFGTPGGPVVFLQHGLAATGSAFDLAPHGPSPARRLAERGFHVFVGNLRGRPLCTYTGTESPGAVSRRGAAPTPAYTFSDYLLRDLPAVIAFIRERTGKRVHWVGHSMGGILGLAYAGHFREGLLSVTSLGSALHYGAGKSIFRHAARLRPLLSRLGRVPWRVIQRAVAPVGWLGLGQAPLCNARNMHGRAIAATLAHVFVDMTGGELLELGTSFEGDGIYCTEIGSRLPEVAANLPVPWLSVVGEGDLQCPPDCAAWTYERVRAPEKRLLLAGRAHGHRQDYGHFDLVTGKHAHEEIWPAVVDFIATCEAARALS